MSASAGAERARRTPMDRARYRAAARHTGVKARMPTPLLALDAVLLAIAVLFVFLAAPRLGGVMTSGFDEFGVRLGEMFPALSGSKPIEIPTTAGTVTAQLTADALPDFTRDPQLKVSGRVPAFA